MKQDAKWYGQEDWERLCESAEDVVEQVIEQACMEVGESFDSIAGRITWPIRILVYRPMRLPAVEVIARRALKRVLEDLDEDHADPEGDGTEPTESMKAAALAFAQAVVDGYVSWSCEETGDVIEYTREQAREHFGDMDGGGQ